MRKYNFDLQLFADNIVDMDTLKDHFSDEELQSVMTEPEPVVEEVQDPTIEQHEQPVETPQEENIVTPDVTSEEEPHADNLKAALKEERERRKVMAAELAALKAQYAQQTPQFQQPAPVQQQQTQQPVNIAEQIAKIADEKVRKNLGITDDIETLQYTDPALYLQYVKGVSKEEYRIETEYNQQQAVYNENVNFVKELQSIPDFPTVYQFALAELDEMTQKQAKPINEAYARIDAGRGSKNDFEVIRNFSNQCKEKMTGITQAPVQGAISTPIVAPTASPLDKAMGLPRATGLSGAKTSAMSWAQVESLIQSGDIDQIPKDMLAQIDKRLLD